tara:strand:+ start:12376 stop:15834 length:3459 start_codon:yes stop_codon:yes gene_type:complete
LLSPLIILDLDNDSIFTNTLQVEDNELNKYPHLWGSIHITSNAENTKNESRDTLHSCIPLDIKDLKSRKDLFKYISKLSVDICSDIAKKNRKIRNIQNIETIDVNISSQDCTIFIKSEITNTLLTPIANMLLKERKSFHKDIGSIGSIQFIINSSDISSDVYKSKKAVSLQELESLNQEGLIHSRDIMWLISDINHDGSYFDSKQIDDSSKLFINHMFTNGNDVRFNKLALNGVKCLFSSFGAASISFDKIKAENYLRLLVKQKELNYLVKVSENRFLKDLLSDELNIFLRRKFLESNNNWFNISEEVGQNSDHKEIYHDLVFDNSAIEDEELRNIIHLNGINHWKLINPFRNYAKIDEVTKSILLTGSFFNGLKIKEEDFLNNDFASFSSELNKSRKRVLDTLILEYSNAIKRFLNHRLRDDENYLGINYAIAFSALLNNNKEKVKEYLRDDTSVYFKSIESIRDKVLDDILQGVSMDTIQDIEVELKKNDLELTEQLYQIDELRESIKKSEELIDVLIDKNNNKDSSKVLQLRNEILVKKESIIQDESEIIINEQAITNLSLKIIKIRSEFNDITFITELKEKASAVYFDNISIITEKYLDEKKLASEDLIQLIVPDSEINKLDTIEKTDTLIFNDFESINQAIKVRNNILKWKILIIPLSIALLMFLLNIYVLSETNLFPASWSGIKTGLISILLPVLILLAHGFMKLRINNSFLYKNYRHVSDLINVKHRKYSALISLINKKYKDEFIFTKRTVSQAIIDDFRDNIDQSFTDLHSLKTFLNLYNKDITLRADNFSLSTSLFDKSLFDKVNIEKFYFTIPNKYVFGKIDTEYPLTINDLLIISASGNENFISQAEKFVLFDNKLDPHLEDILQSFRNKTNDVSVNDIVFNEALTEFFEDQNNPKSILSVLYNNSRPLLQSKSTGKKHIPYIEDKIIGEINAVSENIIESFSLSDLKKIDQDQKSNFTFLSIKSNISSETLFDSTENKKILDDYISSSENPIDVIDELFIKKSFYNNNFHIDSENVEARLEYNKSVKQISLLILLEKVIPVESGFNYKENWFSADFNDLIRKYKSNSQHDLKYEYKRLLEIINQSTKKKILCLESVIDYIEKNGVKCIDEEFHPLILDVCQEELDVEGDDYDKLVMLLNL